MKNVKVRILRPACYGGDRLEAGSILALSPSAAVEAVALARAAWLDEGEAAAAQLEARAATLRQLQEHGRVASPQSPWQPIN